MTIIDIQGSSPREAGARMVVTVDEFSGTVGGGSLELKLIQRARELIEDSSGPLTECQRYSLGAKFGQCCGGEVRVFFEIWRKQLGPLVIFGAGHVGREIVHVLSGVYPRILWIDPREEEFAKSSEYPGVEVMVSESPPQDVQDLPGGSHLVIVTHSHSLDFDILDKALSDNRWDYVGMIGSRTKWQRFQKNLLQKGHSEGLIKSVDCPMGLPSVKTKEPRHIAISLAARLLENLLPGT